MAEKEKNTEICTRFGTRFREIRKEKGFSQEGFALLAGLDRTYISHVERGDKNVTLVNLEKIASTLEISISELMQGV